MMNKIAIASLFLSASLLTAAWAAGESRDGSGAPSKSPSDPSKHPSMEKVDADRNGSISREEGFGHEQISKYWDKLDRNRDGYLDRAEFSRLEEVVEFEEARKTDHPVEVQQYEGGEYISPNEQIKRNKRQGQFETDPRQMPRK